VLYAHGKLRAHSLIHIRKGQSCDRQANLRPRPHLLLSIRLGGRYASCRGRRAHGAAAIYVRAKLSSLSFPRGVVFFLSNCAGDTDKRAVDHRLCMLPRRCSKVYAMRTRTRSALASSLRGGTRRSVRACTTSHWVADSSASRGRSEAPDQPMSTDTATRRIRMVGDAMRRFSSSRTVSTPLPLFTLPEILAELTLMRCSARTGYGS